MMNNAQKCEALLQIFNQITHDGHWYEVTAPSGYTNMYRSHSYPCGNTNLFILETRSGNGRRPADSIGTVIIDAEGHTHIHPLTFKRYLQQWVDGATA
jgi:hypothetical protein